MANEISWVHTGTGKTVYATIRSAARQYWYTVTPALEALDMAHWADYDIALTETPASSWFYVGTWPAALVTVGWYWVDVFEQAGAGPVRADDTLIGTLIAYWNGTTLSPWAADAVQVAGTAQTAADLSAVPAAALVAVNLDHLVKVAKDTDWATTVTKDSVIDFITSKDGSQTFARGTDALEALRDHTPTNFEDMAITDTTGIVTANVTQIAGQTASAAAGVTFPATIGTSTLTGTAQSADVATLITTVGVAGAGLTALGDTRLANLNDTITSRHAAGAAVAKSPATLDWSADVTNKPTIGTSTYAGTDTPGTTTLLGIFSGITSLPKWLRGLFRKDAMDATALSEVNTSGGTFSELTDSLEAIRDTAPLGTAMRGTDGAYTGTPPTTADIKTALEIDGGKLDHLWEMTEDDSGVRRLTTNALEQAPSGGTGGTGLTAQEVRDALKLAPTVGDPAVGSVDAHLDAMALEATLTAIKGDGWSAETLVALKALIDTVIAKTNTLGASSVSIVYPIAQDGTITLEAGDDYDTTEGYELNWTDEGDTWPDLSGATITFSVGTLLSVTGIVVVASGTGKKVRVVLADTDTAKLSKGTAYWYNVKATLSNGHVITLVKRSRLQVGKAL